MKKAKQTLGVIGVGAFGEFMLKHLIPYFDVTAYDKSRDLSTIEDTYNISIGTLAGIAACDVIILAVPVRALEQTLADIKPLLRVGQIVIDVCSVKCQPVAILEKHLPAGVEAVSVHPLFGPQSGKHGIHGLNITVCNVRGKREDCVREFLSGRLGLNVHAATPEEHDKEMAYVQGLTHMIAKVFVHMDVPKIHQQTKTYSLLNDMVELIRYDSDELFMAIERDNPYVKDTTEKFFAAVRALEDKLNATAKK